MYSIVNIRLRHDHSYPTRDYFNIMSGKGAFSNNTLTLNRAAGNINIGGFTSGGAQSVNVSLSGSMLTVNVDGHSDSVNLESAIDPFSGVITLKSVPEMVGSPNTYSTENFSGYCIDTKTINYRATSELITSSCSISSQFTLPTTIPSKTWNLDGSYYFRYWPITSQNLTSIDDYFSFSDAFTGTGKIRFTYRTIAIQNGSLLGIQEAPYSTNTHRVDVTFSKGEVILAELRNINSHTRINTADDKTFFVSAELVSE